MSGLLGLHRGCGAGSWWPGAEPSISKLPFTSSSRGLYVSTVRITPRDLRIRISSSAEAGSLVQALLEVLSAEDVSFVPATKEVIVCKHGDETIVSVLDVVEKQLADGVARRSPSGSTAMRTKLPMFRASSHSRGDEMLTEPSTRFGSSPWSMCLGAFTNIKS